MKPIKVEHTETHVAIPQGKSMYHDVLVAPATLVLITVDTDGDYPDYSQQIIGVDHRWVRPIFISETEKIVKGDLILVNGSYIYEYQTNNTNYPTIQILQKDDKKILALPEHFSPQQLQMIVDGKLKDGCTVLVECKQSTVTAWAGSNMIRKHGSGIFGIKLNPHITIYPVEEKMYSRKDFDRFCEWIDEWWIRGRSKKGSGWFHVGDFYKQDKPIKTKDLAKEWFEQNVK